MDIDKLLALVMEECRRMWRYRFVAIACAWIIALAGWTAVQLLPNQYTAVARVHVNTETVLKPLLQGLAMPTDAVAQVALVTRALLSRPSMEAVIKASGLDSRVENEAEREQLVTGLVEAIEVTRAPNENVYVISYTDRDPGMAEAVVKSLLDDFISRAMHEDITQSSEARRFLEEQIAVYEKRLTEAEERLAAFKKANIALMPRANTDYFARFEEAQSAVATLQLQINAQANRRDEIARQLASQGGGGSSTNGLGDEGTSVDPAIQQMEQQLADLLLRYTDKHPAVIRARESLEDLKKLRDEERIARQSGQAVPPLRTVDPVRQELKVSLSNAEAELASLQAQLRQRSSEVTYLRSMATTMPEIEAQLARLNRDYDVVKVEYETLIQRLNALRLKQEVQEEEQDLTFRVIDPPHAAMVPAGPNRRLFNSLVMVLAVGGGLGLAFVLSQRDVTFFSAAALNQAFGVPVYGTVGDVHLGAQPRSWRFEMGAGALAFAYVAVMVAFSP